VRGLRILSVNVAWDKEPAARAFVAHFKLPYPVGRDDTGEIGKLYTIEAVPTTLFIAKTGRLDELHVGALDEAEITQRVEAILR
jgi:cytochrome c biogenesis protein CcmG/thiol:disulfide interchange protein DsbE